MHAKSLSRHGLAHGHVSPVALVTGASSGIGARTAELLLAQGFAVFGAARRTDRIPAAVRPISLDLADSESISACADAITTAVGPVHVLVNCAGYGAFGSVEETSAEAARAQLEVNVVGPLMLTRALLPAMREAGRGRIVNVSSIAGEFSSPLAGWYHASKFALEALSDALRIEVEPFGVDVAVVQPSFVDTPWHEAAFASLRTRSGSGPYRPMVDALEAFHRSPVAAAQTSDVDDVAKVVLRAATERRPKTRYRAGRGARLAVLLPKLFSDRAFDTLTRRQFGYPLPRRTAARDKLG